MNIKLRENNYAFIDGANLHRGIQELGWKLDYKRFRIFLRHKYQVQRAYLFLGYLDKNVGLYRDLQNWGYTLDLKPTVRDTNQEVKGNCDAELVLRAVSEMYEGLYDKAVIVSGDGDFRCLIEFLDQRNKLEHVIAPNYTKCSILIKKAVPIRLSFLNRFKDKLKYQWALK